MPLYDFTCRECAEPFEKLVRKEADIAALTCPKCASQKIERQLSLPAKPVNAPEPAMSTCGSGPPCGASWCQRQG